MPYTARRAGKRWAIVRTDTGKVAGYSRSRRKAQASARIRNQHHRSR